MKKFLSLVLALVMTMSLVTISAGAEDFADDSKITYEEAVDVMSAVGVVGGYADGSFNPAAGLTRGAAAKIICNMILGPTTAAALSADTAPYKDVAVDNTFAGYIAYCAKEGIISGYADGTFRPAAPLTGYAFMKMLLGAIGYDAANEGYTGANWSINVAKRALNIGLDDGLVDEFVGTKALTREEACLYAFNALQATMVEYDNNTSITVGDTTIVTNTKAQEVETQNDTNKIKTGGTVQFAEKYFTKLNLSTGTDSFGRPANVWKNGTTKIGTYAKEADLIYTAEVKTGEIYDDLGLSSAVGHANTKFVQDGNTAENEIKSNGTSGVWLNNTGIVEDQTHKIGGNGTLVEVYYDEDATTDKAIIVIVHTYVSVVTDCEENEDGKYDISLNDETLTYESDVAYEEDDVVLYTKTIDDAAYNATAIKSMQKVEKITGEVTRVKDTTNFVMDGTTYKYSNMNAGTLALTAVDTDVDVYLDNYGYAIKVEAASSTTDYAVVLAYKNQTWSDNTDYQAKLLMADGTVKVVDSKNSASSQVGAIVTYSVDSKDVYTLITADAKAVSTGALDINKGESAMKIDNDSVSVYGTSKTVFFFNNTDDDVVEAYVGIKNVPSTSAAGGAYSWSAVLNGSVVKAVYIEAAADLKDGTASDVATFFYATGSEKLIKDTDLGNYYEVKSVVDGEDVVTKVAPGVISSAGVNVASKLVVDENGIVTNATFESNGIDGNGDGYIINNNIALVKAEDDVITIGGVAYTYSDDVVVYQYDISDDAFTAKTITGLKTNAAANLAVQLDGNVIIAIYSVVA